MSRSHAGWLHLLLGLAVTFILLHRYPAFSWAAPYYYIRAISTVVSVDQVAGHILSSSSCPSTEVPCLQQQSVRVNDNFDFHRLGVVLNLLRFVIIILGRPAPGAVLACVCHEFQLFSREYGFFTELCCLCSLYSGRECSADADLVPARCYRAGRAGARLPVRALAFTLVFTLSTLVITFLLAAPALLSLHSARAVGPWLSVVLGILSLAATLVRICLFGALFFTTLLTWTPILFVLLFP